MDWKSKLEFEAFGGAHDTSVGELEEAVGVPLPKDYRAFMIEEGGGYLRDGLSKCTLPTPFGKHNITQLNDVAKVMRLLDSSITPRNMICIGSGHFGMTTCLSIAGLDHGHVFALDVEMRFHWTQSTIAKFPSLDRSIVKFFRLRDGAELPERPWGYDKCYHIADSFTKFLSKLRPATD